MSWLCGRNPKCGVVFRRTKVMSSKRFFDRIMYNLFYFFTGLPEENDVV